MPQVTPSVVTCLCLTVTGCVLYLFCPALLCAALPLTGLSLWRRRRLPARRRVVYVVGADTGFGYSSARHLQAAGCRVLAGCLDTSGEGARLLREAGVETLAVDVREPASVTAAAEQASALAGDAGVWAVVFNAGVLVLGHLSWLTTEQVERMVQVNWLGAVRVARAALPALTVTSGRLILISSPCALTPCPEISVYASTKAALTALAQSLQLEWRRHHVDVMLLTPGDMALTTNILGRQQADIEAMSAAMSDEVRRLDGPTFAAFRQRLSFVQPHRPAVMGTPRLRRALERAVLDVRPLRHYTAVEAGLVVWHALSWLLPRPVYESLVLKSVHYRLHAWDADWLDLNNLP